MSKVDKERFEFYPISDKHDFTPLDFTDDDGSDVLDVDKFIHEKAPVYHSNKLTTVWAVIYDNELVGFIGVSMFAMELKRLPSDERVEGATPRSYPAVLLGQMGVDKKQRRRGIGYWICQFCVGLAQELSQKIACRYVVLQTNKQKIPIYEKAGFIPTKSISQEGKIWMYRRLS